ncbi:MAG: N-acetylmuramoyl-L-alanine amidase [Alphaproteobacteria bacterium]
MSQQIIYNKFKSRNYDQRKFDISLIIIHFTETKTFNDALSLLTSLDRKVSSHFLIDKNGDIFNLVDLDKRAWHAGESMWGNYDDINSRSIGIEIVNSGEVISEDYTAKQINSLSVLLNSLLKNYNIENILGHSDIAPTRKIDPGVHFPWQKIYQNLGLEWVKDRVNNERVKESDYLVFLKRLKEFGYPYIKINSSYRKNQLIIDAFHRRYLPTLLYKKLTLTSLNKINDLLRNKKKY